MKHVGIRPQSDERLKREVTNEGKWTKRYIEFLGDGGRRYWTGRTLNSGCGKIVSSEKTLGDLAYCEHCDEYFAKEQFGECSVENKKDQKGL